MVMRVMVRVAAKPGGAEARGAAWRAGARASIKLRESGEVRGERHDEGEEEEGVECEYDVEWV